MLEFEIMMERMPVASVCYHCQGKIPDIAVNALSGRQARLLPTSVTTAFCAVMLPQVHHTA